jgi:hypothetical protein
MKERGNPISSCASRKAAYNVRHNTIVWEPVADLSAAPTPPPEPTRPDEAVAGAVLEARTLAGAFTHLSRSARPQLAWRCEKTGEAIHSALDDYFEGVDR